MIRRPTTLAALVLGLGLALAACGRPAAPPDHPAAAFDAAVAANGGRVPLPPAAPAVAALHRPADG